MSDISGSNGHVRPPDTTKHNRPRTGNGSKYFINEHDGGLSQRRLKAPDRNDVEVIQINASKRSTQSVQIGQPDPGMAVVLPAGACHDAVINAVAQACRLGMKRIIFMGETPLRHPQLFELIDLVKGHGAEIEICSDATGLTEHMATHLFNQGVHIVLRYFLNTDPVFKSAVEVLKSAGYPSQNRVLMIEAPLSKPTLPVLPELWQWARERDIEPFFKLPFPNVDLSPNEVKTLFHDLAGMDWEKYNVRWEPLPPYPGPLSSPCRHLLECLVLTEKGEVLPRIDLPISLGNIEKTALKSIIENSEVLDNLTNFRKMIKGPCRQCDSADHCCGSRSIAYERTGDYMASDPYCWKNVGKEDEITTLPMPVAKLIPQQPPMQVVTRLLLVQERYGEIEAVIAPDSPFAKEDGTLDAVAFFEMMAQAAAVMNAFEAYDTGRPPHKGALLGGKNIQITGTARAGVPLKIQITKKAKLGNFGVMGGSILSGNEVVAQGDFKVFKEDR